jgi:hypothetical protein
MDPSSDPIPLSNPLFGELSNPPLWMYERNNWLKMLFVPKVKVDQELRIKEEHEDEDKNEE